jgi:hypothetical protein
VSVAGRRGRGRGRSPLSVLALGGSLAGLAGVGLGVGCAPDVIPDDYRAGAVDAAAAGADDASLPLEAGGVDASLPVIAYDAGRGVEGGTAADPRCDLNGRWLVAQRVLAAALGQSQASHNWFYYELRQDADQLTVTRGLHCGYEVVHVSPLGADVSSQGDWPALLMHDSDTGRKGTVEASSSGCQVAVEKRYTVRGATLPFYEDPSQALPTPSQQATGTSPGWEDWNGDGHPGITLVVSGAATGSLYLSQRDWNQFSGSVAFDATSFQLSVTWNTEQGVLGYDGSELITESAEPDPDATQHYVDFVRLAPSQATGSDTAICAAVRSLVPTLAPDATK